MTRQENAYLPRWVLLASSLGTPEASVQATVAEYRQLVAYKPQRFVSHSSRGESQTQVPAGSVFGEDPLPGSPRCLLTVSPRGGSVEWAPRASLK